MQNGFSHWSRSMECGLRWLGNSFHLYIIFLVDLPVVNQPLLFTNVPFAHSLIFILGFNQQCLKFGNSHAKVVILVKRLTESSSELLDFVFKFANFGDGLLGGSCSREWRIKAFRIAGRLGVVLDISDGDWEMVAH